MEVCADAVDDLVEPRGEVVVLHHLAGQGVSGGIEEPPSGLLAPVMLGLFPLLGDISDALHADDAFAVHAHDGVIRLHVVKGRALVGEERLVLLLTLQSEGFDELAHKAGEVTLRVRRVLTLDDVIGNEGQVVADEDT